MDYAGGFEHHLPVRSAIDNVQANFATLYNSNTVIKTKFAFYSCEAKSI